MMAKFFYHIDYERPSVYIIYFMKNMDIAAEDHYKCWLNVTSMTMTIMTNFFVAKIKFQKSILSIIN